MFEIFFVMEFIVVEMNFECVVFNVDVIVIVISV